MTEQTSPLSKRAFQIQNSYRRGKRVKPLKWHTGAHATALAICVVLTRKGERGAKFAHEKLWFKGLRKIFRTGEIGENIGYGQDDPGEIVRGFAESSVHERNMRDPDYTHGAFATMYSKKLKRRYWVAHYAQKRK